MSENNGQNGPQNQAPQNPGHQNYSNQYHGHPHPGHFHGHPDHQTPLRQIEYKVIHEPCFTESDKVVLLQMVRVYRGWLFIGKVFKAAAVVLGIASGALVAFTNLVEGVGSWPPW